MGKGIAIILTIVLLSGLFGFAAYAGYTGTGLRASGTTSTRVGSISAPRIFAGGFNFSSGGGGGFSSGK